MHETLSDPTPVHWVIFSSTPNLVFHQILSHLHICLQHTRPQTLFVTHHHWNNSCSWIHCLLFIWIRRPSVGDSFSLDWHSSSGSDSDNQICVSYADLRGCVAGNRKEGLWQSDTQSCVDKSRCFMFHPVRFDKKKNDTSWPFSLFLHITSSVCNVECHVTFVLKGCGLLNLKSRRTLQTHWFPSFDRHCAYLCAYRWVITTIQRSKTLSYGKVEKSWHVDGLPVHLSTCSVHVVCDASVMTVWWRYWLSELFRPQR